MCINMDISNLNRRQWSQLKEALLCAKYNRDSPTMEFDLLPDELKSNEIGLLLSSFLFEGEKEALGKAARMLAPDTENYWVAIERA